MFSTVEDEKKLETIFKAAISAVACGIFIFALIALLGSLGQNGETHVLRFAADAIAAKAETIVESAATADAVSGWNVALVVILCLPLVFAAFFNVSILKSRVTKFNLAFVIPVSVLLLFCYIIGMVRMFEGNMTQSYTYLAFEVLAMLTLMIFNLIECSHKMNIRASLKRVGIVGVCVALIAISVTSVFRRSDIKAEADKMNTGYTDIIDK